MSATEVDPFLSMKIQSRDFLDQLEGRSPCPKCIKSRKFYCYNCCVLIGEVEKKLRKVKLPIKVDIIKHPNEVDGKSTAPQAAVISPDEVTLYIYPCIPDYDRDKVILVFPCEDSVQLPDLVDQSSACSSPDQTDSCSCDTADGDPSDRTGGNCEITDGAISDFTPRSCVMKGDSYTIEDSDEKSTSKGPKQGVNQRQSVKRKLLEKSISQGTSASESDRISTSTKRCCYGNGNCGKVNRFAEGSRWKAVPSFERVVFIDSTWRQSKQIFRDERLSGLRHVELKTRRTRFWRPQGDHPDTYLATIEAIYYFIRDFHDNFLREEYHGEYDNLLFFFLYMYEKVQQSTSKKTHKSFDRPT